MAAKIFSYFVSALGVLVALSPIILIHEFGHFIVCRLTGIRVKEFSFGLGKILWAKRKGRTKYCIRAIPFGGFVNPAGEMFVDVKDGKNAPKDYEFASKKWWQKLLMVVSGAFMNYVLAFIIFTAVALAAGRVALDPDRMPPAVETVASGMSAEKYGVKPGDVVVGLNGARVDNWQDILDEVKKIDGDFTLSVRRGNEIMNLKIDYAGFKAAGGVIGIGPKQVYERMTLFTALGQGAYECWKWTKLSITSIYKSIAARHAPEMSGPVGIITVIHTYVHTGLTQFIWLIGLLSLAVGLFNLFPIPVLDGGYALMFLWEGITGKAPTEKFVKKALDAGLILLVLLVLYATFGDVKRIFKKPDAQPAAASAPAAPEKK